MWWVKIIECGRSLRQMVLPIFCDVDPLNVLQKKECFADAFARHKECFALEKDKAKVASWRMALNEVVDLSE